MRRPGAFNPNSRDESHGLNRPPRLGYEHQDALSRLTAQAVPAAK